MVLLLDPYVDAILVLALAYLSLKIVQALFGPLGGIPALGKYINEAIHAVSQSISHACGEILQPIDVEIGRSLAGVASLVNRFAGFIRGHARAIAEAAGVVAALAHAYSGLRSLARDLHRGFAGIEAGVKTVEREFHGIEHRVKTLERLLTHGIGHDLRLHIKALEKELGHVENKTIPAIQSDVATADSAISNLYDWAKGKADLIGIGTFAAAIGVALSKLGLDWIKCKEGKDLYNQRGCAMWSDLSALLGVAFIAAEVASLEELIGVAQTVTEDGVKGAETLLKV